MGKKVDIFTTSEGSTANIIKVNRDKKKKRLDEIMGEMGHNKSGKYPKPNRKPRKMIKAK